MGETVFIYFAVIPAQAGIQTGVGKTRRSLRCFWIPVPVPDQVEGRLCAGMTVTFASHGEAALVVNGSFAGVNFPRISCLFAVLDGEL